MEEALDLEQLLTPQDAVAFLNEQRHDRRVTVDILRQMRRKGRVKALQFGKANSRTTLYRVADLLAADLERHRPGRPHKENGRAPGKEGKGHA